MEKEKEEEGMEEEEVTVMSSMIAGAAVQSHSRDPISPHWDTQSPNLMSQYLTISVSQYITILYQPASEIDEKILSLSWKPFKLIDKMPGIHLF